MKHSLADIGWELGLEPSEIGKELASIPIGTKIASSNIKSKALRNFAIVGLIAVGTVVGTTAAVKWAETGK